MPNTKTLKEEWMKCYVGENTPVFMEKCADFWLSKLNDQLSELYKEVEKMIEKYDVESETLDTYLLKEEYEKIRQGWSVHGLSDTETSIFAHDIIGKDIEISNALNEFLSLIKSKMQ